MKALVLESKRHGTLRDIDVPTELGEGDVGVAMRTVGICGSEAFEFAAQGAPDVVKTQIVVAGD